MRRVRAREWIALVCAAGLAFAVLPASAGPDELSRHFEADGTEGTMVVRLARSGETVVVGAERSETRYLPASTFKIPNSLIALKEGVAEGPDHVFEGPRDPALVDGKPFLPEECNGDITLRDAFRLSCVNVYQEIAREVGEKTYRRAVDEMDYGNEDVSGAPVDEFWLEGDFAVSATEQVAFLRRLYRHRLRFSEQTMRDVEAIMVSERAAGYVLRSKTGWAFSTEPQVGWWVGWVETDSGVAFFALNLDITRPEHAAARQKIGRSILSELGILPSDKGGGGAR